jgi:hypothetical protein
MLREIAKIASKLDSLGMTKEADVLDKFLVKAAQDYSGLSDKPAQPGYATHGYPGGDKSKATQGFLYASPRTLAEFNDQLAELFEFVPETSQVVSPAVLRSLPYGETQWTKKTANAFSAFCSLVFKSEADRNWEAYANANGYEPTLAGVIKFWNDNKQAAYAVIVSDLKSREKAPPAQTAVPSTPNASAQGYNNMSPGSRGPAIHTNFKAKLYAKVTGGTGVSSGGNLTNDIMNAINSGNMGTKEWFAMDPNVTLFWTLRFPLNEKNVDSYLKSKNITNTEIFEIYDMMISANEESNHYRDNQRKRDFHNAGQE